MYVTNDTAKNPWMTLSRPNPSASLRLFCFPYSGAGASVFYKWSESLPAAVEVCPIQLPGRENRLGEPLFSRLPPLIRTIAPALVSYMHKPFAFFGHSLGALLSFELARYLRRHYGLSPAHLFVSGHSAPQLPEQEPPIHDLPEPEFLTQLRRFNGTPEAVLEHKELRELILPILRSDFAIYETYVYEEDDPLDCPISAFGGLDDVQVSHERLDAWRTQTRRSFTLRMFPGDHFFLNTARPLLLQTLARELNQLTSRSM